MDMAFRVNNNDKAVTGQHSDRLFAKSELR